MLKDEERKIKAALDVMTKLAPVTTISRAERRRLSKLMEKDDARNRGSANDSEWFAANPDRNFRMRLATPAEIETTQIASNNGEPLWLPRDAVWWTVVKQITPGVRIRGQVYATMPPPELSVNAIPEEIARDTFESATRGKI